MNRAPVLLSLALLTASGMAIAGDVVTVTFHNLSSWTSVNYTRSDIGTKSSYAGEFNLTVDGIDTVAYCVDLDHTITPGLTYEAELVEMEAESPYCEIGYILANYEASDATWAASIQAALWELVYEARGISFTINSPSTVKAYAEAMEAEAAGTCPISCSDTVNLDFTLTDASDGYVHGYISAVHGTGVPVAGQEVVVTIDSGTLVSPADGIGMTDENGFIDVVIDLDGASSVTLHYAMDGRTLYTLVPTISTQQLLAFQLEECTWEDSSSFTVTPFGDPRTIGFWKHQYAVATGASKGTAQVDADTLTSYLPFTVLGTTYTTNESVYNTLWLKKATDQQRALQQCTATYLNLLYGQYGWLTPIAGGDEFWTFWADVEDLYASGDYEEAKDICDGINNL